MMRLSLRRTAELNDTLDPELVSVFRESARRLDPGPLALDRMQAKVAARIERAPAPQGGLRRRLALGSLGGGALWATVIGSAAAHKAVVTAVGLSLLLGGGVAAETTGVGEAVREAVSSAVGIENGGDEDGDGGPAQQSLVVDGDAITPEDSPAAAQVEAADDVAGNLVTVVREDGSFLLRAALISVDGDILTLDAAGGSTHELTLAEDAVIHMASANEASGGAAPDFAATLEDLGEGTLVLLRGQCENDADPLDDTESDCVVTEATVLGGVDAGFGITGQPDGVGQPQELGQPEGVGQPDNPGQPGSVPPVEVPTPSVP